MKHTVIESSLIEALKNDLHTSKSTESSEEKTAPSLAKQGTPLFKKGKSGNPAGRPKGALGKSTLVKQAIMAESEGLLLKNAPKVIQTVIEQAKKGCLQSQRLIWQSIIPAKRAVEISAKDDGPAVIKINIQALESSVDISEEQPALEAEFEEISNGD